MTIDGQRIVTFLLSFTIITVIKSSEFHTLIFSLGRKQCCLGLLAFTTYLGEACHTLSFLVKFL